MPDRQLSKDMCGVQRYLRWRCICCSGTPVGSLDARMPFAAQQVNSAGPLRPNVSESERVRTGLWKRLFRVSHLGTTGEERP
jgi:hypothetical protein